MGAVIRDSTIIDRPAEEVWPYIGELEKELAWRRPFVLGLEPLEPGPVAAGTRIRGTTKAAGMTDTYVNEVTELDPPRRYAWRGVEVSGSIIGVRGSYDLEPVDPGKTRVTIEIEYEPTSFGGRLQMPIWRLTAPRILRRFLGQLDEAVTSGSNGD